VAKVEISERGREGQKFYISSMEKSAIDKTRVFPFVREGIIADMGAGAGPITELLSKQFPQSKILAVDNADDMVTRLRARFKNATNVEVIAGDVQTLSYSQKINTILFISVLHEIFSFANYSHQVVIDTLRNAYRLLSPGGRLIIRDGVQPEQEVLYLQPRHEEAYKRFHRFVKDFRVRPLVFAEGTFRKDSFVQQKPKDFAEFEKSNFLIEMASQDVSEFLSKYFYPECNWKVELTEQFGIWTLREYQHILLELGFFVSYAETYVLPYLLETHYRKDVDIFKLEGGQLVKAPYPPSTMILVAEK